MRGVGGNFTGREPDTELLVSGDFIFDLVAKATFDTSFFDARTCGLQSCGFCEHVLFASCQNFRDMFGSTMRCLPKLQLDLWIVDGSEHGIISQHILHFGIKVIMHGGTFTTNRVNSSSNTIPGRLTKKTVPLLQML